MYKVTIKGLFTPDYVPGAPPNALFSPLTVVSHARRFSALSLYGYATEGIKEVAETGNNSKLLQELSSESAMPFVKSVASTDGPFDGDAEASVVVMVDCKMSVITAVSMLAPSPDWIIAAANINMWNGEYFKEKMEGQLHIYDAGTDSGATFLAEDMPTMPRENIAPLGEPFTMPVANYTIERVYTGCRKVKYDLTLKNLWTTERFPGAPEKRMLSPLTAFSHSKRFSAFMLSGYASAGVQKIAEEGDNSVFLEELAGDGAKVFIKDVSTTDGPALMGKNFTVELELDCMHSYVSFISMLAPSPDWIVAKTSVNAMENGRFKRMMEGELLAYDAGTDSGETATAENMPTDPKEHIAMLQGAPFYGQAVAKWTLKKRVGMGEKVESN